LNRWLPSTDHEHPGPTPEENVNAEQAGNTAIDYLKKMGFSFVQVLVSSPESTGTGQVWRIEADVGYTRKRIARIWIDPGTGEVIKHEVEA
jgi:hypothetical protein